MLKIEIIGNLGRDAEMVTGNFAPFLSFSVAHSHRYQKDGQEHVEVVWVSCVVNWDASKIMPFLRKGAKVYARGSLRTKVVPTSSYGPIVSLTCVVDNLELCGGSRPDTALPETPNNNSHENENQSEDDTPY